MHASGDHLQDRRRGGYHKQAQSRLETYWRSRPCASTRRARRRGPPLRTPQGWFEIRRLCAKLPCVRSSWMKVLADQVQDLNPEVTISQIQKHTRADPRARGRDKGDLRQEDGSHRGIVNKRENKTVRKGCGKCTTRTGKFQNPSFLQQENSPIIIA